MEKIKNKKENKLIEKFQAKDDNNNNYNIEVYQDIINLLHY